MKDRFGNRLNRKEIQFSDFFELWSKIGLKLDENRMDENKLNENRLDQNELDEK